MNILRANSCQLNTKDLGVFTTFLFIYLLYLMSIYKIVENNSPNNRV